MSDDKLVLTLLKEVRDDQKDQSQTLLRLEGHVEQNTKDLREHKEGVIQNRKRIEVLESAKNKADAAKDFYNKVKGKLLTASKILSAIGAIIGFIYSWINNLFSAIYDFFF